MFGSDGATIQRLGILTFVLIVLFGSLVVSVSNAAERRPNILLILTDDQRWDTLGCSGAPLVEDAAH